MNIDNTEKGIGWFERVLALVDKYKIKHFIKAAFVVLLIAGIVGFIKNPLWAWNKMEEIKDKQHKELMDTRLENSGKIQAAIDKLLYKTNASRVIVMEYHNSTTSLQGVPYLKGTAVFEGLNENVRPVSDQYKDIILTLVPFASHLSEVNYWYGNTEDMKYLDKSLCYKLLSNGTNHFAAATIEGINGPIGVLIVSFEGVDELHNCEEIRNRVVHTALEIGVLMELRNKR